MLKYTHVKWGERKAGPTVFLSFQIGREKKKKKEREKGESCDDSFLVLLFTSLPHDSPPFPLFSIKLAKQIEVQFGVDDTTLSSKPLDNFHVM